MLRCLQCNKNFRAKRVDALFCSLRCRVAYHRSRKTESNAEEKVILSLCDFTGNWSKPYKEAGYQVICIDIKLGQDVRFMELPTQSIYGILAAPPCTVFAASGNRWHRTDAEILEGLSIVDACLRLVAIANPKFWVLENPVGKLVKYLGKPAFYFDPCDYGGYESEDNYTKKTCLWGKFNRPRPDRIDAVDGSRMHLQYGGVSEKTKTVRSTTPLGFAQAFYEFNK